MIVKRVEGFYVRSEKGKNLGGPYKTKKEAQKRLGKSNISNIQEESKMAIMERRPIHRAYVILLICFSAGPFLAGADKFFNFLGNWPVYFAPQISDMLPMSRVMLMRIIGVIEMAAGILVLLKPRQGALIVSAWLFLIVINLVIIGGFYDIAVRDALLALAALALASLSESESRLA